VDNATLFWLNRHPCSKGLAPEAVREVADQMEMVSVSSGEEVHQPDQPVSAILFIIKGRLKQSVLDCHGRAIEQSFLTAGSQFGLLASAQEEPVPLRAVALEPSTFLRLDFQKAMSLASKHPGFLLNLFRIAGNQLRQVLRMDRIRHQPALVAMVHQASSTRNLTPRLLQRLAEIEKQPCVFSDDPDWRPIPEVAHRSLMEGDRMLSREVMREQASRWSDLGRVFYDVKATLPYEDMRSLLEAAEQVLWCVDPDNWRDAVPLLRDLGKAVPRWRDKINLVWMLNRDREFPPPAAEILELVDRDFKVSFDSPSPNRGNLLRNGLERIVHQLRGVRIGLALGGGAARGMAHLGVLKALEENGIVIDAIAGTSAGAMTGTVYASGLDLDYSINRFVEDLRPSWFFRRIPRGGHWHLLHKYRRGRFDPMLRKYLADLGLEQLPIPMNTVTVDLVSGRPVVRDRGDAVEGILESINLPVLSSPICRHGQALVDGGLVNNIPADVLAGKGCNFVIAVSVTAKLEQEFASIRPGSVPKRVKSPSTLQTILRGYLVQHVNMNSIGVQPADFVIEPEVTDFGLTEFARTDELAVRGAEATRRSISEVRSTLARLDKELFSESNHTP
jgi:predicted acylesterase/phospholipase RssA/CRP-like cAMP-binding protein